MASIVPDFRAIRAVYGIDRAKTQGSSVLGKGLRALRRRSSRALETKGDLRRTSLCRSRSRTTPMNHRKGIPAKGIRFDASASHHPNIVADDFGERALSSPDCRDAGRELAEKGFGACAAAPEATHSRSERNVGRVDAVGGDQ